LAWLCLQARPRNQTVHRALTPRLSQTRPGHRPGQAGKNWPVGSSVKNMICPFSTILFSMNRKIKISLSEEGLNKYSLRRSELLLIIKKVEPIRSFGVIYIFTFSGKIKLIKKCY
jgi:hypothetical protein